MDTDYFTLYATHQDQYAVLLAKSDHARLVQQAIATQLKHPIAFPMRVWLSTMLIAVGEWIQPKPASALIMMDQTLSD
jgi:hypothetical protein